MNLQQLEYIIAVDTHRHFVTAAASSHVTQATLSMMIKKLEEELDIKIFDRSRQPVVPTEIGAQVITQAKTILGETRRMREIVKEERGTVKGELRIGLIPTLAPHLLPLFINRFLANYPQVKLKISELTTEETIHKLENHHLDAGILATPLHNPSLIEQPLFYEEFMVYASSGEKLMKKKYVLADDIDVNRLWLLEEGHCLRSQVINLCELKSREKALHQLDFEAGSITTLKKIVEANHGMTILPELAVREMTAHQKKNIRPFRAPAPVREISIVTYRNYLKKNLIDALKEEIVAGLPKDIRKVVKTGVVEVVE